MVFGLFILFMLVDIDLWLVCGLYVAVITNVVLYVVIRGFLLVTVGRLVCSIK